MSELSQSFHSWVPEWLIRVALFSCLMPSMMLFFLPGIHVQATAGYYGCQPNDAQFLIVLFYAGFVGAYILERRFFQFFPIKTYYMLFHGLQILNCILMYLIQDITWVYPLRFFQGMLFASAVNLSMSMIFSRIESSRAKVVSYSIFFGLLLVSSPFNNLMFAWVLDDINFKQLYAFAAFSFLPGLFLLIVLMKPFRHVRPYPLYKLDWGSFIFYSILFICAGFMAVYGQERYWFTHPQMRWVAFLFFFSFFIFHWRQRHLKRPYLRLGVFASRRYWMGITILYIMYIERFSIQLTNQHFGTVLGLDPEHLAILNILQIAGVVAGVAVSAWWTLKNVPIKYIWITGFFFLFLFQVGMFFRLENFGNEQNYWGPLFAHGMGIGLIMVPTILFIVSTVKEQFSISAAALALATRFMGFISSTALLNYFELGHRSKHFQVFRDHLTADNPIIREQLRMRASQFAERGLTTNPAKAGIKNLYQQVMQQAQIRTAMDYYEVMMILSLGMILFILLLPSLKARFEKWRYTKVSPV